MIRMLNETPTQYVTWGNHEADLSHEDVMCRVEEYQGVSRRSSSCSKHLKSYINAI